MAMRPTPTNGHDRTKGAVDVSRKSRRVKIACSIVLGAMLLGSSVATTAAARPAPAGCALSNGVRFTVNGAGAYVIKGTKKADTIDCSNANVIVLVEGGAGDDTITGGSADDIIYGNAGADSITGLAGNDAASGGEGNDIIVDGDQGGIDNFSGDAGDDILDGNEDGDTLHGGSGNDHIFGGLGDDILHGAENDDTIDGGAGNDNITGGDGADLINGRAGDDTVSGDAGNDIIIDGDQGGNDSFSGGAGNDVLDGNDGNDSLDGGLGDDELASSAGVDSIIGGDGVDWLSFGNATQGVNASVQAATANGDGFGNNETYSGIENLIGGAFEDQLTGDDNSNILQGGDSSDNLTGGGGNDTLVGGLGNDGLVGEDGDDLLFGSEGSDLLVGGNGNDALNGGPDTDDCQGGPGTDTYFACETETEPAVDLVVADLRIGDGAFEPFVVGDPSTVGNVDIRLRNQGGTAVADSIKINLHFSNDGGATLGGLQMSPIVDSDIAAGATTDWITIGTGWNVCCGGGSTGSWLVAVVDPDDTILESDDTNNQYALVLYPAPPDLIITDVELTGTLWGGGGTDPEYAYRVTVMNQGGSAAQSSEAGFGIAGQGYYSEDTAIDGLDAGACAASFDPSTTIAPGASLELFIGCSGGPQAVHDYLLVRIDEGGFVTEGSESNNVYTQALP
jgi:Ca2+-binding RTX toxin-like protein